MFNSAHNFTVNDSVFIESKTTADNFMEKLLQETIIGAEFDSSVRHPPPRCHPGTRLAIIQRCLDFINQCSDEGKLRWVVGPAGVGKSAIMQMVTETALDNVIFASIFLSINGRSDGKKILVTIAYQLAVKCGPYRQFIRDQINLDPSLLGKSLPAQFNKFIVEPFMFGRLFEPSRQFLIVIDGLDECDDPLIQRNLLELITEYCTKHPTSPIAWIIASRPEPQITLFFDKAEVKQICSKEQIEIDSDEACEEVQRYLRDELKKIKVEHPTLRYKREWPLEHEFTKIASAAGGLFAYAATVIRYIGDRTHGGPAAQLRRVLEVIDTSPKDDVAGRNHPMDRLDALYKRILSNVPDNVIVTTRKLLLMSSGNDFQYAGFRGMCNALELTEEDAYDAIGHLHAVMKIPEPDQADAQLSYYHKSFGDFLSDSERSGFSHDFNSEIYKLCDRISLRIIDELQDDCADGGAGGEDIELWSGLMNGQGLNISLSWPADERFDKTDESMRITLYTAVIRWVEIMFPNRDSLFGNISCFHALTKRFTTPTFSFPFHKLRESAFDQFRQDLTKLGKLKRVPLRALDYAAVCGDVSLRFTNHTGNNIKRSDLWHLPCEHEKEEFDDTTQRQGWSTKFQRYLSHNSGTEEDEDTDIPQFHTTRHQQAHQEWVNTRAKSSRRAAACIHCSRLFARHFVNNPDLHVFVFVDSTLMSYVEASFVDPDDGVSEWRYRFLHSGPPTSLNV